MNELFNSPFELSLRVLIILNTAQLRLTIDKIVAYDFISTYSSDFGISESNLHAIGLVNTLQSASLLLNQLRILY